MLCLAAQQNIGMLSYNNVATKLSTAKISTVAVLCLCAQLNFGMLSYDNVVMKLYQFKGLSCRSLVISSCCSLVILCFCTYIASLAYNSALMDTRSSSFLYTYREKSTSMGSPTLHASNFFFIHTLLSFLVYPLTWASGTHRKFQRRVGKNLRANFQLFDQ